MYACSDAAHVNADDDGGMQTTRSQSLYRQSSAQSLLLPSSARVSSSGKKINNAHDHLLC